jgi:diguanylate cyclase (GGDEF)-like protein
MKQVVLSALGRRATRPRAVVAAAVGLLACASVGVGAATHVRQAALARRSAYSVTWRSSQAATEAGRVVEQAAAALAGLDEVDADDVRLRLDVLVNRLGMFDAPEYAAFLDADPEAAVAASTLRSAVARAEGIAGDLASPAGLLALRAALVPALGPASVLAGAAHRYGIERTEADRDSIATLYAEFCALVAATAIATAALGATVVRQKAELARLAHHDGLTGLANRRRLATVLAERLGPTASRRGEVAVLCLDLDRFKAVNDQHGHAVGDALLVAVARRLGALMAGDDLLARIGGDEFVAVTTARRATALAAGIVAALDHPVMVDGADLRIGTSVGVALAPVDGDTAGELMRAADAALYRAKRTEAGWLAASRGYEPRGQAA